MDEIPLGKKMNQNMHNQYVLTLNDSRSIPQDIIGPGLMQLPIMHMTWLHAHSHQLFFLVDTLLLHHTTFNADLASEKFLYSLMAF